MRFMNFTFLARRTNDALTALLCLAFVGCTKGGSISSGSTTSTITGAITVGTVYPTAATNTWTPIKAANRYFIIGHDLSIEGTCTRGITTIRINEGGANYTETALCLDDGTWKFDKTYTLAQEGDKTLNIAAYDVTGLVITGTTIPVDVRVDGTPPAVPIVTTPATSPYTSFGSSSSFPMVGTCAADVDHLTGPAGVTIACSGGAWNYTATLNPGGSADFTFYTWDLAGNQSAGTTQTIIFTPSLSLLAGGVISGGSQTDTSGNNYKFEASMDPNPATQTDTALIGYKFLSGFNYIVNEVRAQ
jgi:hypothetical protein